jgi:hypothetical protein
MRPRLVRTFASTTGSGADFKALRWSIARPALVAVFLLVAGHPHLIAAQTLWLPIDAVPKEE